MDCPNCQGMLKKPTDEQKSLSLLIYHSEATHICKNCKTMWSIHEMLIPKSKHESIIIPKSLQQKQGLDNNKKHQNLSVLLKKRKKQT